MNVIAGCCRTTSDLTSYFLKFSKLNCNLKTTGYEEVPVYKELIAVCGCVLELPYNNTLDLAPQMNPAEVPPLKNNIFLTSNLFM